MKIYFDLDNTLSYGNANDIETECRTAIPLKKGVSLIRRAKNKGYFVVIFTSRPTELRKVTEEWLSKYQVPYDKLVMDKPKYDLLIGDKVKSYYSIKEFSDIEKAIVKSKKEECK